MELALITVKQVVVLFILIFAGFVCVKTKAVKMEGKKAFSDLLLYLICLLYTSPSPRDCS